MNDRAAPPPPSPPKPSRAHRTAPPAADSRADPLAAFAATPIFEVDREERLEALATTGRGPRRMAAAVMLAADTRRANLRARRTSRRAKDGPAEAPAPAAAPEAKRPPRAARPTPTPKQPAASPTTRAMTPARLRRARTAHQVRLLNSIDPAERVADDAAWERWVSTQPEPDGDDALAKLQSARETTVRPWRQRVSQALDRWAEREVERGARLEDAVVPKRHDDWAGPARRRSKAS